MTRCPYAPIPDMIRETSSGWMPSGAETRPTDMIIDAHTHIIPTGWRTGARNVIGSIGGHLDAFTGGTRDGLLASMDAAGVDHSWS